MTYAEKLYNLRANIDLDMERYLEQGFTLTEMAAVFASNSMYIYRQLFNDEDYDRMMTTMYEGRKNVKKSPLFG
jgi:hypothetical protein